MRIIGTYPPVSCAESASGVANDASSDAGYAGAYPDAEDIMPLVSFIAADRENAAA